MADDEAKRAWVKSELGVDVAAPGAGASGAGADGVVAYRTLLLEWDKAKKSALAQIAGIRQAVEQQYPPLAQAAKALDRVMERFNSDLSDALDAAMNAGNGALEERQAQNAMATAQRYFMMVNADPLFRLIDDNPIAPITVRATLGGTLKKLMTTLPK